jgi:hypothetical protein
VRGNHIPDETLTGHIEVSAKGITTIPLSTATFSIFPSFPELEETEPVITVEVSGSAKSVQVGDTVYLKVVTLSDAFPVEATYTWISSHPDTLKIVPYPGRTDTLSVMGLCGLSDLPDSVSIIAISSAGGRDTFRIHVIPPTLSITPALAEGQTETVLPAAGQSTFSFTATTTESSPSLARPLSATLSATANWSSDNPSAVYINRTGKIFSRDTGRAVITLFLVGATVTRTVTVPLPTLSLSLTAGKDTLSIEAPLQLSTRILLNGSELNPETHPDAVLSDTFAIVWQSLDTAQGSPVTVTATGLVNVLSERLREVVDSVQIAARVQAFGLSAPDTLRLYLPALPYPPASPIPFPPEKDPHETEVYEIYTIDGRRILRSAIPPSPLRLYILRTSHGTFKLLLPQRE